MIKCLKIKIVLLLMLCIFILPLTFSFSRLDARELALEYTLSNELLNADSETIVCINKSYYVFSALSDLEEVIFYIPVSIKDQNVSFEKKDVLEDIFRANLLLKSINTTSNNNYLNSALTDKIDRLIIVLNNNKAQLDGLITQNYNSSVTQAITSTRSELIKLINNLESIHEQLVETINEEKEFLASSNCKNVFSLLTKYDNSFNGYSDLVSQAMTYRSSINKIIEKVVASEELDDQTKTLIINYTREPQTLLQETNVIYESLSSTKLFYEPIISDVRRVGDTSLVNKYVINFQSREDYVIAKRLYLTYDVSLNTTLREKILFIIDASNVDYWNNQETVEKLIKNYSDIENLYNSQKYSEVIPKLELAKMQVNTIIKDGYFEYEEVYEINYNYIYIAIILIVLLLALKYRKKIFKFSKNLNKKTKSKKDNDEVSLNPYNFLEKDDPFKKH